MWRIEYSTRGPVSRGRGFYGDGSYTLLKGATTTAVYRIEGGTSRFLGFYGDVALPPDFPAITFAPGVDQAMVTNG